MSKFVPNHRILNAEEELDLIKKAKFGETELERTQATQTLITHNHKLVAMIASKYANDHAMYEDLVQEGIFGLYPAIKKFEIDSGFRFSTYAGHWIRQTIRMYLSNHSRNIRTPSYVIEIANKAKKARATILATTGVAPTLQELADYLMKEHENIENLTAAKLYEFETALLANASLDFKIGEESTLADVLEDTDSTMPDTEYDIKQIRVGIDGALDKLTAREERIIRMRYGIGSAKEHTLDQIAEILNMTKERVRQIQNAAERKLGRGDSRLALKALL